MKKSFSIISLYFLLLPISVLSQAPQGIPYQAVVRNADGSVMANSAIILTFKVHDIAPNGTVVFEENHTLTSNSQGLVSCIVGNGTVSQGIFTNINWGSGAKFLHVIMGTTDLGTQQMMSVPYALHSESIDILISATGDTLTIGDKSLIIPGLSGANPPQLGGLGSQVLVGNTSCSNKYISITGCGNQTSLNYDGRSYDLVEIGGQCWFADNLATDQYSNGDPIPTGLNTAEWQNTTNGAFTIYNNDPAHDATYGKLYNWYATVDIRGLCPSGWHVPSDCEWMFLENSIGMPLNDQMSNLNWRGTTEGSKLKSTTTWVNNSTNNNIFNFNALAAGFIATTGNNGTPGSYTGWWTSTSKDFSSSYYRLLYGGYTTIGRGGYYKNYGFSLRCVKN